MRILGIDYGTKEIGLAISDEKAGVALPYRILINEGVEKVAQNIKKICAEEGVRQVVVGLPLEMSGAVGRAAQKVQKFIGFLKDKIQIPAISLDERLTSKEAKVLMKGSKKRDFHALAAMLILSSYLQQKGK